MHVWFASYSKKSVVFVIFVIAQYIRSVWTNPAMTIKKKIIQICYTGSFTNHFRMIFNGFFGSNVLRLPSLVNGIGFLPEAKLENYK